MHYKKSIRLSYSIKNDDGFMIERKIKFVTLNDACVYIKLLKQNTNVVGKPVLETK